MNRQNIERLEANGVDPSFIAMRINLIALLGDIQEGLAMEVESKLRKAKFTVHSQDLVDVISIKQAAKRLRAPIDRYMKEDAKIGFGVMADELREVIFEHVKK